VLLGVVFDCRIFLSGKQPHTSGFIINIHYADSSSLKTDDFSQPARDCFNNKVTVFDNTGNPVFGSVTD